MMGKFTTLVMISLAAVGLVACTEGKAGTNGANSTREDALRPRPVSVVEPVRSDFQRSIRTTGSLQPQNDAVIRALASGPITELSLDVGDFVEEGDVLFVIRPESARLAVKSAEAALLTARASLEDLRAWRRPEDIRRLEAQKNARQAELDRLLAEKERSRELFENRTIPASEWDSIRASVSSAEAALIVAHEDLAIAKAGPTVEAVAVAEARVAEANAALDNAQMNLDDTRVTAPFSGFVTARHERVGGFATRGDDMLRLSSVTTLEAEMYIPERFSRDIHEGQTVSLSLQSNGDRTEGTISRINPAVEQRTRNFLVKVIVDNTDQRIKAGSFAIGTIELDSVEAAMAIPRQEVLHDEGRP
ncbi:MAG: efflux RND transporter periplasmic adaptor subunit, partial [Candidatus Sumerlaeia bacterium]|nr:efflux RND transporter periplasmic adaptor subunit [Candidatus Sumerlaeia bacterium]